MNQLYVVTQSPRDKFRHMVGLVWFAHAVSKSDAIRQFLAMCQEAEAASKDPAYKKPEAHVVMTGGTPLRV